MEFAAAAAIGNFRRLPRAEFAFDAIGGKVNDLASRQRRQT
jgi:hypothetical protein